MSEPSWNVDAQRSAWTQRDSCCPLQYIRHCFHGLPTWLASLKWRARFGPVHVQSPRQNELLSKHFLVCERVLVPIFITCTEMADQTRCASNLWKSVASRRLSRHAGRRRISPSLALALASAMFPGGTCSAGGLHLVLPLKHGTPCSANTACVGWSCRHSSYASCPFAASLRIREPFGVYAAHECMYRPLCAMHEKSQ
jgi:hypothetical protein